MNKHIVVAVIGLTAIGLYKHYTQPNIPLTRIYVGSFVLLLALSVADLAGGQVSKFASALAMLALLNGILTEIPPSFVAGLTSGGKVQQSATVPGAGVTTLGG